MEEQERWEPQMQSGANCGTSECDSTGRLGCNPHWAKQKGRNSNRA